MTITTLTKQEAARIQLETALRLFDEGGHKISVITLASAAEEILGQLVTEGGGESSLASLTAAAVAIHQHLHNAQVGVKRYADRANRAKNSFKHHTPGQGRFVSCDLDEEAVDMLDRAISNWWQLDHSVSPAMKEFIARQGSIDVKGIPATGVATAQRGPFGIHEAIRRIPRTYYWWAAIAGFAAGLVFLVVSVRTTLPESADWWAWAFICTMLALLFMAHWFDALKRERADGLAPPASRWEEAAAGVFRVISGFTALIVDGVGTIFGVLVLLAFGLGALAAALWLLKTLWYAV